MFVGHTDGYAMNRNNFRLYHDPYSDRFVFITHGLDWGFGNTGLSVRPPFNSLVVRAVLETPEGIIRYRERVGQVFTNAFKLSVMTNRLNEVAAKLKAAARNPAEMKDWETQAGVMRDRILERARNITQQLEMPEPITVAFDAAGMASISGWRIGRLDNSKPALAAVSSEGKSTLYIDAGPTGSVASWRSRLQLQPGKYRFLAMAKTKGVVPRKSDIGTGAGVRISGGKRTNSLAGDCLWTPLEFAFELAGAGEVDLVCELRAEKGEAWFDRDSLRLSRLK
jgi:hypothetical protein